MSDKNDAATALALGCLHQVEKMVERIRKFESDREASYKDYQSLRDRTDDLLREFAREKERVRELKGGLREMLKAEWMVTCDWTDSSKRTDLLDRMEELLETPR